MASPAAAPSSPSGEKWRRRASRGHRLLAGNFAEVAGMNETQVQRVAQRAQATTAVDPTASAIPPHEFSARREW